MPELPEVETVANDLHKVLAGKTFQSVELINTSKVLQTPLAEFKKALIGNTIKRVYRRAKMVVMEMKSDVIVFHLKMTGQLIYVSKKKIIAGGHPIKGTGVEVPNKYTCLVFHFKDGNTLYFNDLRKFGWVRLMSQEAFSVMEERIGIEPLESEFKLTYFTSMLARRGRAAIKAALLDQKHVVGLGNIYVDEVLFRAKVRPDRRIESLSAPEKKRIWQSIAVILTKAISERGTTFRNFLDPDGLAGNFVPFLKVYGRGSLPCKVCGRPLRKTRVAGRGTHWCENCQS